MIDPLLFLDELSNNDINFFCGVPDSLLKNFCLCIDSKIDNEHHITTANEGNAIALATGYHLATKKAGLVYLQNSGIGNSLNPLISLSDQGVYQIPMILLIGWRGEPSISDEPQHVRQGEITESLLKTMGISYEIIDSNSDYKAVIRNTIDNMKKTSSPAAIIVRKNCFDKYQGSNKRSTTPKSSLLREPAIKQIISLSDPNDIFISTTGKTSRELYEIRLKNNTPPRDFITVGSMGHASSISLGVSIFKPSKRIICLDGDGALLMHLGSMATIGSTAPSNMVHVLLNNGCHESVGGQATVADKINFQDLSKSLGYKYYYRANSIESLIESWKEINSKEKGLVFLELIIQPGSREDLARPKENLQQIKQMFMEHLDE